MTKSVHLNSVNLTKCYRESARGVTTVHSPQTLSLKVCFSIRFFLKLFLIFQRKKKTSSIQQSCPSSCLLFPRNIFPEIVEIAAEIVSTNFKNIMIIINGGRSITQYKFILGSLMERFYCLMEMFS